MQPSVFPRATVADSRRLAGVATPLAVTTVLAMARYRQRPEGPPARPVRLPFTSRDPLAKHRAITGINAHVRWYQRIASLVGIVVLVGIMGVLVAALMGAAFIAARIVLELLVG